MREIEVKARVRDTEAPRAACAARGIRFNDPSSQHDTIYIKGEWEAFMADPKRIILRIREQTGRAVLTLKQHGSNELDSLEHETAVASPTEAHRMLAVLGYRPVIEVKKKRRTAHAGKLELCLDQVEGLGDYVEVERLVQEGIDAEAVQAELFAFLQELGISPEDRETRGYDTLVRLKGEGAL